MTVPLRVFFDFSCPYCYIAWGFFKELKKQAVLEDDWVTWEIHPDIPKEGRKIQDVVTGVDMEARRQKLNTLGEPVGLAPGDKEFVPNTRLALSAVEFAREHQKLHAWIDAVYQASFVQGQDIGDIEILLTIAGQLGLDSVALRQALESGRYVNQLLAHDQECADRQIEWVPTVYCGDERILEGAFTYAIFEQMMRERVL